MPDDWKTIRVPKDVYDDAKQRKEEHGVTWGEYVNPHAWHSVFDEPDRDMTPDNPDIASVLDASEGDIEAAKDEILGRIDDLEARLPRKVKEELR